MKYDFDRIIERKGTGALKYDALKERYGRDDLLPLWVADLDFETPDFITDAIRKRLDHSLFGYTITPAELWDTIAKWIYEHHEWKVRTEWLTFIPGVMKGVGAVINTFVKDVDIAFFKDKPYTAEEAVTSEEVIKKQTPMDI